MSNETTRLIEPTLSLKDDFYSLAEVGGHIGYDVRPSERRRGYGNQILRMTLDKARDLGLKQVLVTADSPNGASWRIIEKNGGVLHGEASSQHMGQLLRKYWIEL
jgi:predicted acetyltransferase